MEKKIIMTTKPRGGVKALVVGPKNVKKKFLFTKENWTFFEHFLLFVAVEKKIPNNHLAKREGVGPDH